MTAAVIAAILIVAGTCRFYRGAQGPHPDKILIKTPKQNGAQKTRSLERRVAELEEFVKLIIARYNQLVTIVQKTANTQDAQLAKMKELKEAFDIITIQSSKGESQSPPKPSPDPDKQGKNTNYKVKVYLLK